MHGGLTSLLLQLVVSQAVSSARPRYLWLGGGEVDMKLRVPFVQLVAGLNAHVLDCTEPRSVAGDESE